MARNPKEDWPNGHTVYAADSGAGKGSMIRGNPDIPSPAQGARIICWDTAAAFPGYFFTTRRDFVLALENALNTGLGFSIGYTGGDALDMPKEHEWWSNVVWDALDGARQTFIIDEELHETSLTTGKAVGYSGLLLTQSRKYGGVWHGTVQRPQEIPKTLISQSKIKYFGRCDECDVAYLSKWMANSGDLLALKDGEFYRKQAGQIEKGRYAKVDIVRKTLPGNCIHVK